jgi:hypothetical protein
MSSSTQTLSPVSLVAERALFGQPGFTVIHSATATILGATYTPVAANSMARMFHLTLSYSAAPAASTLTVKDGSTIIWQAEISATGPFVYVFDFSAKPLRGSNAAALSANVGSAGGAVVQTISWTGDEIASA